jgi:hypothetical protein
MERTRALWLYLCTRATWVRVFLGSLLWLGLTVAVVGSYLLVQADLTLFLSFGGVGVGTYGLGYLVGNWWALTAPLLSVMGLTVLLVVTASNDPDFGLVLGAIWLFFAAPLFFLTRAGIGRRQRESVMRAPLSRPDH